MTSNPRGPNEHGAGGPSDDAQTGSAANSIASLHCDAPPDRVMAMLRTLSQRGKLPGFEPHPGGFRARAFGDPFDHWLNAGLTPAGSGSKIEFSLRMAPRLPLVVLAVTLLTIQPGMWLTHSMLATYFPWYGQNVSTWWWYLPLVVLPMPVFVARMWSRSVRSARTHAFELRETLGRCLLADRPSGASMEP